MLSETVKSWPAQWMAKGRKEGIEKGIEKGRDEGKTEAARNMLADGLSIEVVEKYTGLSREKIEQLMAEQKNTVSERSKPYKTTKPPKKKTAKNSGHK